MPSATDLDALLGRLSPKEADAQLHSMWKSLATHKDWPALASLLNRVLRMHESRLLDPGSRPTVRAFHAGATAAVRTLITQAELALAYDADSAIYTDPADLDEPVSSLDPIY